MPKPLISVIIAAAIGYLFLKQLPSLTQALSLSGQPLVRPVQSNLASSVAIAGAATGVLSAVAGALNSQSKSVADSNDNQIFYQDLSNEGVIVPAVPSSTSQVVPATQAIALGTGAGVPSADLGSGNLSSIIGTDLPISDDSTFQGLTADLGSTDSDSIIDFGS